MNKKLVLLVIAVLVIIIGYQGYKLSQRSQGQHGDLNQTPSPTLTPEATFSPVVSISPSPSPVVTKPSESPKTTTQASPLKLTASVDRSNATYTSKEKINFKLKATNTSNKDITLTFSSGCMISYTVGSINSKNDRACTANIPVITIKANSSYDFTETHYPESHALPQGTYTALLHLDAADKNLMDGTPLGFALPKPAPVTFKIVNADAPLSIEITRPRNGQEFKIGETVDIIFNLSKNPPAGSVIVYNFDRNDIAIQPTASNFYSIKHTIPSGYASNDIYNDMPPGTYFLTVSVYDGNPTRDANGRTCSEQGRVMCSLNDRFGKLLYTKDSGVYMINK